MVLVGLAETAAASCAFPSEEDEGLICFLLVPRWISGQRILYLTDKLVFQALFRSFPMFWVREETPLCPGTATWWVRNPRWCSWSLELGTGEQDRARSRTGQVRQPAAPRGVCDAFGAWVSRSWHCGHCPAQNQSNNVCSEQR